MINDQWPMKNDNYLLRLHGIYSPIFTPMKTLMQFIAPKSDEALAEQLAAAWEADKNGGTFESLFLNKLLENHISVLFDNTISLEELIFNLRKLITDNHINIHTMPDEMDENVVTDDMLNMVGGIFKKQGWAVCDFNRDPAIYHLSIVPFANKKELEAEVNRLGLYIQFFD